MTYTMMRCYRCMMSINGCNGACASHQFPPPYQADPPPKGCICPPGSEETCRRFDCGRRDLGVSVTGTATEIRVIPEAGE